MNQSAALVVEQSGPVATITLNRPDSRNAINREMSDGLLQTLEDLDHDPDVQAIVLVGAGRGFCSGMDLAEYTADGVPESLPELFRATWSKPLIAAVEGFAVAGGFELALTCDLIVAAEDAVFGLPEAKVGLVAWYAAGRIQRLLPRQVAADLLFTGTVRDASSLADRGLVTRLVDPGQALATAQEMARHIAQNAPMSLRTSKALLDQAHGMDEDAYAREALILSDTVYSSHDSREGARAFMEKRPPVWLGK